MLKSQAVDKQEEQKRSSLGFPVLPPEHKKFILAFNEDKELPATYFPPKAFRIHVGWRDRETQKKMSLVYTLSKNGLLQPDAPKTDSEVLDQTDKSAKDFIVGRNDPAGKVDIPLESKDQSISRKHVRLVLKGANLFAQDLKSRNGTYLQILNEQELESGKIYRIGRKFKLRVDSIYVQTVAPPPKWKKPPPPGVTLPPPSKNFIITALRTDEAPAEALAILDLSHIHVTNTPFDKEHYYEVKKKIRFGVLPSDHYIHKPYLTIGNNPKGADIADENCEEFHAKIFWSAEKKRFTIKDGPGEGRPSGDLTWVSLSNFEVEGENPLVEIHLRDVISVYDYILKIK